MKIPILITGAGGQIGTELALALRERYGNHNVIVAGHRHPLPVALTVEGSPNVTLDILDTLRIEEVVSQYKIGTIYHLAGILSAVAAKSPQLAWQINVDGLRNILSVADKFSCSVFFPSSIGAFGPESPPDNTPQDTIQWPRTIYGITKVTGELLCDYYHNQFGIDCRGLRFPGLISSMAPPGGGTTDYAVDIFYAALRKKRYTCFLSPETFLDMMYMPDAVRAAIELMEAKSEKLIHRNAFNITAMSFSPRQLAMEIQKHIPEFSIEYQVDPLRQSIADSWPNKLDDSAALSEWDWRAEYDLPRMVQDMLDKIGV